MRSVDVHALLDRGYQSEILENGWAEFNGPNPEMAKCEPGIGLSEVTKH